MKRPVAAALAAFLLACSSAALAHPALVKSAPGEGVMLETAPAEIMLRFSEPIEPAFTTLHLTGESGAERPGIRNAADRGDTRTVFIRLPPLPSGAYQAHWSAVGRDGHRVRGVLGFAVK